jgi:hypothetical protein
MATLTYLGRVIRSTKDEFGSAVVAGTDVGHVRFPGDQQFRRPKVTQLQNASFGVEE